MAMEVDGEASIDSLDIVDEAAGPEEENVFAALDGEYSFGNLDAGNIAAEPGEKVLTVVSMAQAANPGTPGNAVSAGDEARLPTIRGNANSQLGTRLGNKTAENWPTILACSCTLRASGKTSASPSTCACSSRWPTCSSTKLRSTSTLASRYCSSTSTSIYIYSRQCGPSYHNTFHQVRVNTFHQVAANDIPKKIGGTSAEKQ